MRQFLHLFYISLLFYPGYVFSAWDLNMTRGVTTTSEAVYGLHMTIFYICLVIAIVVFGVMFWSIFHHRKSKGAKAAQFHGNVVIEVVWTIIPFIILIAMAVPATRTLIDMYDPTESDIDIQITGHQWKWHYKYIGEDLEFFSLLATSKEEIENRRKKNPYYLLEVDNSLVIPINRKIRFLFTSNDVIHAWWVPDLAVKKDAVPGFINEAWTRVNKVGTYRGQCAELCGKHHGFMPIEVKAVSEDDYAVWLQQQKDEQVKVAASSQQQWSMDNLITRGAEVYEKNCAVCHQSDGSGMAPIFPALNGSAVVLGDIKLHTDIVMNGRTGTAMPAFAAQLSAVDIAAVITYERNAWDNKTTDQVAPTTIQTLMDEGL